MNTLALAENLTGGGAPLLAEPTNVRELIASLEALHDGRWTFHRAADACQRLLDEARHSAARAAEALLANPQFCTEYRVLIARLASSYRVGADALEALVAALREERVPDLEPLALAQRASLEAYAALSRPAIRCPRCAREAERCQVCGLEGLFPDPGPLQAVDVSLLPSGLRVLHQTMLEVGAGWVSAEAVAEPIRQVHEQLQSGLASLPGPLRAQVEGMLEALELMDTVFQTRQLQALHRGWDELYARHCALLEAL